MNDSLSVSSSSSSNNSNANSLNRSLVVNASYSMSNNSVGLMNNVLLTNSNNSAENSNNLDQILFRNNSRFGCDYLQLNFQTTPIKRRSKSQIIYYGDDTHTIAEHNKQLIEDLYELKKQLKDKDNTINKLNDIRDKLESEIQELSASLFEQAYLMVNKAKAEQAHTEKLLKEANGKIDVLQAEVKALKELVLTSTPSTPNKHLHPQLSNDKKSHSRQSSLNQQSLNNLTQNGNIQLNGSNNNILIPPTSTSTPSSNNSISISNTNNTSVTFYDTNNMKYSLSSTTQPISHILKEKSSSFFNKSHKRVPSHNDVNSKSLVDKLFQHNNNINKNIDKNYSSHCENVHHEHDNFSKKTIEIIEFDPVYFKELLDWKESAEIKNNSSFMNRVYNEEIYPCLNFPNKKTSDDLLYAIELNLVCIEELNITHTNHSDNFVQTCALSNIPSLCQYKIKLSESGEWLFISKLSRNRVISVCDFFTYLRYIKDGLVKSDDREIYWNIIELRKKISLSKLGF